jgi:hypothetical protein
LCKLQLALTLSVFVVTYAFQCLSCHHCLECMLEGHDTIQLQDISDNNDWMQYVEKCVTTKILSAKDNWTIFFFFLFWHYSPWWTLASSKIFLHSNLRSFLTEHIFMRWSCQAPRPTPNLEDQVWIITPDLSGIGGPTSGYTTNSIAFRIIWPCKPHHSVKVGIPLGWRGGEHWTLHNRNLQDGTQNTQWHKRVWWTVEHSFDKNVTYLQCHDTNDFISIRIILWQ